MSTGRQRAGEAVLIGLGATATMDVAAEAIRRATGVAPLDYRLLGRWIGHMRRGRFTHDPISAAAPVAGEKAVGTVAHYSIGIALAGLLVACRPGWTAYPTLVPAMVTGLVSTVAPFTVMQPAFGMGLAASRTSHPTTARLRSLRTHGIYGMGLYLSGQALARVRRRGAPW